LQVSLYCHAGLEVLPILSESGCLQSRQEFSQVSILKRQHGVIGVQKKLLYYLQLGGRGACPADHFMTDATAFKGRGESSKSWNQEAIKATYVASQLKELG